MKTGMKLQDQMILQLYN